MTTTNRTTSGMRASAAVVLALALAAGVGLASAQDGDEAVAVSGEADQQLLDRLVDVQADLPDLVPDLVLVGEDVASAELAGAFGAAGLALDDLQPSLLSLFVDADDVPTAVGDAVADVAEGLLREREALAILENVDEYDLERALDVTDDAIDGVAIDADEPAGLRAVGVELLLDAREQQRLAYDVLRSVEDVGADFGARYVELDAYARTTHPALRAAVGLSSRQQLVDVSRFDAPVGEARATAGTYVCVDAQTYRDALAGGLDRADAVRAAEVEPDDACLAALEQAGQAAAPLG